MTRAHALRLRCGGPTGGPVPGAWHVLRSYEGGDAGPEELEQGGSPQWGGVQDEQARG